MHTVLDIIHAADKVSNHIGDAHARSGSAPDLSPKEHVESIIAKNRVLKLISRQIKDVESALKSSVTMDAADVEPELVAMDVADDTNKPPGDVIREGMSGKDSGLGKQNPSLEKMAENIGPIVDTFKDILTKPYLKNYNAMLNTIPIVGLKGDNIMYTETKSRGVLGVEEDWSVFGRIPDNVNIDSSKAVHFFPYKGDFCMSIGTAIWRRKHRDDRDPEVKKAVDNWPKLYVESWEKVGDNCLPVGNAWSILPFARLSGKDIRFHLVILGQDGRLLSLNGDLAGSNNSFTELKNSSDAKNKAAAALSIKQAAYFNGNIVAYDSGSNTWNLDVDFDASTFTASDQMAVDPLFELTATDIGPVAVQSDGWIYRRRLETVNDPSDKTAKNDKKAGWQRWIQQKGVTHLGVASPGVMLDLETLTGSLRDRYMDTQKCIYPVVSKLQTFATNQELFLKKQLETAEEYQKNEDSAAKQKIAIKEAKKLVLQTKIWATIMRKQSSSVKDTVNGMGTDLSSVRTQLDQQLIVLRDKLVSLQAQIKATKEAKAKMDAAFWGSIGVMLLGIGLAVLGAVTGVGVIALGIVGGALFVGGLVAACHFGSESAKLAGQIEDLEAEARGVQQAITDIKSVADRFGDLEKMYENLNMFWGRMFNAASSLGGMNEATALQIGAGVLEDTTSIEASISVVTKMKNGCATYLAVLNRTGIKIPRDDSDDDSDNDDDEAADVELQSLETSPVDPGFKNLVLFNKQVDIATQALENDQFTEYVKHLEVADLIDVYTGQMGIAPEAVAQVLDEARQREGAEAADIFGDLANFARFTPLGMAVGMVEEAVSRDVDLESAPQDEQRESGDIFGILADFARVSPVGMIVNTIGTAAEAVARDVDLNEQPATTQSNGTESADIFGDLANFARFTPMGMTVNLVSDAFSRDVDLNIPEAQVQSQESADIFGVIADFARFTPVGFALGGLQLDSPNPVQNWFLKNTIDAATNIFATVAPFSSDHPSSGMLNGMLGDARNNVLSMLDMTLNTASVSEGWMKQIPAVPESDEEISKVAYLQAQALLTCKQAMEKARLANNAFVDFNHLAQQEQERLQREINFLRDRIQSTHAQGEAEIREILSPRVTDFFDFGIGRVSAMQRANEMQSRLSHEIDEIQRKISQCSQDLQSGHSFMGHTQTWVELCERTSGNLGSIYGTLMSVKYGIKIDAAAYKELADTQWGQIRKEADEVKAMLQGGQNTAVAMDIDGLGVAADVAADSALVQIASPTPVLLSQLEAQTNNSTIVWENIGKLQRLTYTEDIVGYFDAASNRKVTLNEVIQSIRNAYTQTAALHYGTVEQINTLALLQSTRANNLASGKISPHVFLKGTFSSVSMARKQSARVKSQLSNSSAELSGKLKLVKASIGELKKAISSANIDLARRDKAYRDKVTGIIVEGCLTGFATGGLVAAAAFAAYSGVAIASIPALLAAGGVVFGKDGDKKGDKEEDKPEGNASNGTKAANGTNDTNGTNGHAKPKVDSEEEEVPEEAGDKSEDTAAPAKKTEKEIPIQKRVEAAQDTWTALSGVLRTVKDAASGTELGKALFNKMSLQELGMLVQLVKTAIVVMERSVAAVEHLSQPLEDLLSSVAQMADILSDMDTRCSQYQVKNAGASLQFGKEEAETIKARWAEVGDAAEAWLDVFNAQRISPITYTVV
ncbi:hypothetical protein D7B24_005413 [Verticillium nonalfalfae]|uniref:Uncharacterized protein n=1 Tax=Verticillium nonalfalfae TaxID=1051616 RepID=A0A3M9YDE8_9PEZI|nr:uncharacterized protein D7B24_005413 [Verticillium nonalfalfae]RNJ57932.1 hypothetical protein D7B24_005413 [Verticillium nonalfalfae]